MHLQQKLDTSLQRNLDVESLRGLDATSAHEIDDIVPNDAEEEARVYAPGYHVAPEDNKTHISAVQQGTRTSG